MLAAEHGEEHAALEATALNPSQVPLRQMTRRMTYDEKHFHPARWWFASSAFPMVAGTLGPVASAFSICALVNTWRETVPSDPDVSKAWSKAQALDDPRWLTVINAVQLVMAVGANLALLLNMTRRLRFTIAQPLTMFGWYFSSVTLAALTATALGPLQRDVEGDFTWSQAFYYGIYSSVLYFVVASLMAVTFYGAYQGHYPKDFVLTTSQRTLMMQTIMLLMYLLLGALLFSKLEGWKYLDAVYWAQVTLFTIGFGDLYPQTTVGRALLLPYSLVGIISVGLVIGSIRSLMLERGRQRMEARMVEKERRQLLKRMAKRGTSGILVPISDQTDAESAMTNEAGFGELERREVEFDLMRRIQQKAEQRRRWTAMAISGGTWVVLWLVGAKIFQQAEKRYQGWSYFDGVYFTFVSLTTIGYGDMTPLSPPGKSFFVFWSLMALPTTTILISNAGDTVVKFVRESTNLIGNVTILPGDQGFRKDIKTVIRSLSCGLIFDEDVEPSPPGFHGAARRVGIESDGDDIVQERAAVEREDEELDREEKSRVRDQQSQDNGSAPTETSTDGKTESQAGKGDVMERVIKFSDDVKPGKTSKPTDASRRSEGTGSSRLMQRSRSSDFLQTPALGKSLSMPRISMPDIPDNRADYLVTLIEEIRGVTRHLKSKPPRKYTFQEWAWYLKLMGQDESNADMHREARPHQCRKKGGKDHACVGHEVKRDGTAECEDSTWSWVGVQSPLMGSQEEAEWVLDQLTRKLAQELKEVRDDGQS